MTVTPVDLAPESLGAPRAKFFLRALPFLSFAISLLFLLTGIGAFSAAYLKSRDMPDGFAWKPPMDHVTNRELVPSASLLPLTDLPAEDALDRTLESTDLESAFAMIAYDPRLSDPSRVGALLQLGTRYSAAKNLHRAAWSYQTAAVLATLSPALSDSARIETLLTAGTGLRAVNAKEAGRRVLDQAYLIAVYSPALRRSARANRLNQIAAAYESLGLPGIADQARSKAQDLSSASDSPPMSTRAPFIPLPGKLPPAPALDQLRSRRELAAVQLLEDVTTENPKSPAEWPADSLKQLKDALLQEDAAREDYYKQQFPLAKEPAVQMALSIDRVNWLALKYRIARGGFGAAIVPEWTPSPGDIAEDLSDAWSDLHGLYQAQASALANSQDVNQATEDVLKQQLIVIRWGWSLRAENELHASLSEVTTKLRDASVPALRLDTATRAGRTMYLLLPDELYGQGARVFPQ